MINQENQWNSTTPENKPNMIVLAGVNGAGKSQAREG